MTNVLVLEKDGRREVLTRNLVPGAKTYGENLVRIEGKEYRAWDPFRSKLAGAIIKGPRRPTSRTSSGKRACSSAWSPP